MKQEEQHPHQRRALTHILNLKLLPIMIPQIQLQSPIEQFQKHLKTAFGNGWVITAFAEFVADKCVYHDINILGIRRHSEGDTHAEPKPPHKS